MENFIKPQEQSPISAAIRRDFAAYEASSFHRGVFRQGPVTAGEGQRNSSTSVFDGRAIKPRIMLFLQAEDHL